MSTVTFPENRRRATAELLAKVLKQVRGDNEATAERIRKEALAEFTKTLDAKIANLQEGESLLLDFNIDIIRANGKIRGGSGSNRNMPEYIEWRKSVFSRDNYTCQECGQMKDIQAHHIKRWSSNPQLRFDIDNGITLCRDCHAKKHPHIGFFKVSE